MNGIGWLLLLAVIVGGGTAGMAYLGKHSSTGPDDPLDEAVDRLYAELRGFPEYVDAVGFASPEHAAYYLAEEQHREEVFSALAYIEANPGASGPQIRQFLCDQGYPTSRIQRLRGYCPARARTQKYRRREVREMVREAIEAEE